MAIFHSPVASGLRTKVGAVFAQAIVIARLAQWYVMRKAGPTLPRYGSDLVANAFGFIANTSDLRAQTRRYRSCEIIEVAPGTIQVR